MLKKAILDEKVKTLKAKVEVLTAKIEDLTQQLLKTHIVEVRE